MKRFQFGLCEWALGARGAALCKIVSEAGLEAIQLGDWKRGLARAGLALQGASGRIYGSRGKIRTDVYVDFHDGAGPYQYVRSK